MFHPPSTLRAPTGHATLQRLLAVEGAAVAGCAAAASRLVDATLQQQVAQLGCDHARHVQELRGHLVAQADLPAQAASEQHLLVAGKMMVAQVLGDRAILQTLAELEAASNAAYEEALGDASLQPQALEVVQRNFLDERKHCHWLQRSLRAEPAGLDSARPAPHAATEVGDFRPLA